MGCSPSYIKFGELIVDITYAKYNTLKECYLISKNVDLWKKLKNEQDYKEILNGLFIYPDFREAYLFACVKQNKINYLDHLLKFGSVDYNCQLDGKKPLDYAVISNNLEMCKILVTNGAKIGRKNIFTSGAYKYAKKYNRIEILEYFDFYLSKIKQFD